MLVADPHNPCRVVVELVLLQLLLLTFLLLSFVSEEEDEFVVREGDGFCEHFIERGEEGFMDKVRVLLE